MSTPNDGGPAFPQSETVNKNSFHDEYGFGGMTLRDWFAGNVVSGLMANPNYGVPTPKDDAAQAYAVADAMLVERTKEKSAP